MSQSNDTENERYPLKQFRTDSFGLPAGFVTDGEIEAGDVVEFRIRPDDTGTHLQYELRIGDLDGKRSNASELHENPSTGQLVFNFPSILARVTPLGEGLDWGAESVSQQTKFVDGIQTTFEIDDVDDVTTGRMRVTRASEGQTLRPYTIGSPDAIEDQEPKTLELVKDPFERDGKMVDRYRVGVPREYAEHYGIEPQDKGIFRVVVRDGNPAVAVEPNPDETSPAAVQRTFNQIMTGDDGTAYLGFYLPPALAYGLGFVDESGETSKIALSPEPDHIILAPEWD